jgi:hypothetical protein
MPLLRGGGRRRGRLQRAVPCRPGPAHAGRRQRGAGSGARAQARPPRQRIGEARTCTGRWCRRCRSCRWRCRRRQSRARRACTWWWWWRRRVGCRCQCRCWRQPRRCRPRLWCGSGTRRWACLRGQREEGEARSAAASDRAEACCCLCKLPHRTRASSISISSGGGRSAHPRGRGRARGAWPAGSGARTAACCRSGSGCPSSARRGAPRQAQRQHLAASSGRGSVRPGAPAALPTRGRPLGWQGAGRCWVHAPCWRSRWT